MSARCEREDSSLRRFGPSIAIVALLIGVVGLATRPRQSGSVELTGSGIGMLVLEAIGSIAILAGLAGLAILIAGWPGRRKRKDDEYRHYLEPIRIHWAVKLLLIALPLLLLGGVVAAILGFGGGQSVAPELTPLGGRAPLPIPGTPPDSSPHLPSFGWVFAGVALLLAVATSAWLLRERATRTLEPRPPGFTRVVDDGLDALEREADPRRAVMLAYYAMERALARQGLARNEPETPVEYILRVLTDVPNCSAAGTRLTELFEEARFSDHPIASSSRASAVAALTSIRQAVQRST